MRIILNGQEHEARQGSSLLDLLKELGLADQRVAALLDGEIVRKSRFEQTLLKPDCRLDLIQMVGGG